MPGIRALQSLNHTGRTAALLVRAGICLLVLPSIPAHSQPSLQSGNSSGLEADRPSLQPAASPLRTSPDNQQIMPVEEAFSAGLVREGDSILVLWDIAEGYYLYQDKFSFSLDGLALEPEFLTEPEITEDEFFGETAIYRNTASIALDSQANGTLEVHYQGCAEYRYCYPPTIREFTTPD